MDHGNAIGRSETLDDTMTDAVWATHFHDKSTGCRTVARHLSYWRMEMNLGANTSVKKLEDYHAQTIIIGE